jgi:hypothetical protein
MTPQETSKRKIWLRRAGLITGIAGIIEIFVCAIISVEGGPNWQALIPALVVTVIYCFPLIVGMIISWRRSFMGGITLILIAAIIFIAAFVNFFGRPSTNPTSELLIYSGIFFASFGLPYLLAGIFFILSSPKAADRRQKPV